MNSEFSSSERAIIFQCFVLILWELNNMDSPLFSSLHEVLGIHDPVTSSPVVLPLLVFMNHFKTCSLAPVKVSQNLALLLHPTHQYSLDIYGTH